MSSSTQRAPSRSRGSTSVVPSHTASAVGSPAFAGIDLAALNSPDVLRKTQQGGTADVDADSTIRSAHNLELKNRRAGLGTNIVAHLAANSDQPLRIQDVTQDAEPFWDRLGLGSFNLERDADLDWEGVERFIQSRRAASQDNGDAGGPRDAQDGDGDAQARPDLSGIDVQELSDEDVRRLFPGLNLEEGRRRYRTQKQADDRQLELFLSNGPDPSQAGPAGEAAQRAAVSAVDDLRSTATILGLALSRDYAARQRVSLVGQQVSSPEDLAVLAQVYRDPRFETFRVIFTNSRNEVVSQVGLTSRLPAAAAGIVGKDVDGYLKELTETARSRGATGFYMLHNHPSGVAEASTADKVLTQTYANQVPLHFHGHVVIDTNEYSVIDSSGRAELRQRDFGQPPPPASGNFAGRQINSPNDVMAIAKELEADESAVTFIVTNWKYQVVGITTVPADELRGSQENARRVILRATLRTKGSQVFAVGRDLEVLKNIGDHIVDGAYVTESGQVQTLVGKHRIGIGKSPFPQDRRTRLSPDTSPEFEYLRARTAPPAAQRVAEPEADFRRGGRGSMTEAAVRQVVDSLASKWSQAPTIVVVPNMQDLRVPQAARIEDARQRAGGAVGVPRAFYHRGTVYLVADGLTNSADAAEALFHEALGHYGLRALFGSDLLPILDQIALARPDLMKPKAEEYGKDLRNEKERREVAEEVLAELAQTKPNIGFVKRAIAAIRTWLRRNVPALKDMALTDAEIIQNYILPARGWVERGEWAMRPGSQIALSRSPMKSVSANVDRGLKALSDAVTGKATVHRAMFRNGLGWVDFVWGDEGTVKPNGRTKGGKGLSHIVEARMRKDGLTEREAIDVLSELVRTIAAGEEFDRKQVGDVVRVGVRHDGFVAWLTKQPGANAWIVTGYEVDPDRTAAGRATAALTTSAASRTRDGEGAGSGDIMTPDAGDGNAVFSRSTLGNQPVAELPLETLPRYLHRSFKPLAGELAPPFDETHDLAQYVVIPCP